MCAEICLYRKELNITKKKQISVINFRYAEMNCEEIKEDFKIL